MTRIVIGSATHQVLLGSLAPMIRAIGSSLGPNGRVALFDIGGRVGRASSGVAIARETHGAEGLQGIAQKILTETLVSADRDLGDGTARLALTAEAAFRAGVGYVSSGISATKLAEALAPVREDVARMIASHQCDVGSLEDLAIGAGVDRDYAEALTSAFEQVGSSGVIEIASSPNSGISTEIASGFLFEGAVIGSVVPAGQVLSLESVHVIAADDIISDFGALAPVIDGFAAKGKSLLIVARDVTGPALVALERNRKAGILSVAVMKPADAGPRAAQIIEDLALATGAALVAERSGLPLSALKPHMLGRAASLRLAGGRAELRGLSGSPADVVARARAIEGDIRKYQYLSLDREHAERRRARLLGRWAEIRVGGSTDYETDMLVATGRNALACLRSASQFGAICGGGNALRHVAEEIAARGGNDTEIAAGRVAAEGLRAIERQLYRNAGRDPMSVDLRERRDLPGRLVRDPLRLTQILVDQAFSIAGLLLRVDAAVVR
ncbi:MAG: chaperonin GroL [Rhizobium sp.]|nr:chaperonin GroL [Rhizobium sp.]